MVQADPLLDEALASQRRIAWLDADRSPRADASAQTIRFFTVLVEEPLAVKDDLHPELGQEATIGHAATLKRLPVRIACANPMISIAIGSGLFATPFHKLDPDPSRLPDRFHFGARLGLVHAEYVAAKAIEERRDPSVGDAVHVHRDIL